MLEWLLSPIDPTRAHEISTGLSWHARIMVLAWGIMSPTAILVARFYKVTPKQSWPEELDNRTWWKTHWMTQTLVLLFTFLALGLIISDTQHSVQAKLHVICGYAVIIFGILQGCSGIFRGSKGGPTARGRDGSVRGDHYDMTPWRLAFERLHKSVGYIILALVAYTIPSGMWASNAPVWMFLSIGLFWICLLVGFVVLQTRGYAIETYQAIWGPDQEHPGNQQPARGWGVRRLSDSMTERSGK